MMPPARTTRPESAGSSPVSMRTSVVLPPPLRPTTPMRAPSVTPTVTPASSVRVPSALRDVLEGDVGDRRHQRPARASTTRAPATGPCARLHRAAHARGREARPRGRARAPRRGRGTRTSVRCRRRRRRGRRTRRRPRAPARGAGAATPPRAAGRCSACARARRASPARERARASRSGHLGIGRRRSPAQPVALAVDRRRRQPAVGEHEHPVVAAAHQHRGEVVAAVVTDAPCRRAARRGRRCRASAATSSRRLAAEPELEERVDRDEGGGRVGAAAGHAAGDRDALADRERDVAARRRTARAPARRAPRGWCASRGHDAGALALDDDLARRRPRGSAVATRSS